VTARVTVKDVNPDNKRIALDTICTVGDSVVVDGEALLMVSRRAEVLAKSEVPVEAAAAPRINAAE
jgi:3-hydroxybutyryl-CoA dehydratase